MDSKKGEFLEAELIDFEIAKKVLGNAGINWRREYEDLYWYCSVINDNLEGIENGCFKE